MLFTANEGRETVVLEVKDGNKKLSYAAVSSLEPGYLWVYCNTVLVEKVAVHGPTHTWWDNNPLFVPALKEGDVITVVLDPTMCFRIEHAGLERV